MNLENEDVLFGKMEFTSVPYGMNRKMPPWYQA